MIIVNTDRKLRESMKKPARVTKLIQKTKTLDPSNNKPATVLSENKVTGWSLNFPIQKTCQPSKLCIETCYFASGMTTWTNSLRKQLWNYESCVEDPIAFAEDIISQYDKKIKGKTDFLRWNGGGDLFLESTEALNYIGQTRPDIVIWIVTRRPDMAKRIENHPNLYVHFSLDRESMTRRKTVLSLLTPEMRKRVFFSYQTAAGEEPDMTKLMKEGVKLFFFDNYRVPLGTYWAAKEEKGARWDALCPLNKMRSEGKDIEGACNACRRCFDGSWEQ